VTAVALSVDLTSVAAARSLVRDALAQLEAHRTEDAILLVSEVVTNAVRHTRHMLLLRVDLQDHVLRVEVTDDHPDLPVLSVPEDDAISGRGLRIVNDLANHWGVAPAPNGKTVWFEIDL
jgi:anti-sigma regulatory factor (Ser/Thr protein kinase)